MDLTVLGIEVRSDGVLVSTKRIKELQEQTERAEVSTNKLAKGFSKIQADLITLNQAYSFVTNSIQRVYNFTLQQVKAYEQQDVALSNVASVIRSTGNAAGLTLVELSRFASELQRVTKFGDETTLSAQGILLSFKSIGKDIFPDATKAALDMSTVLGQGLKESVIQIGKALQEPIQGVTALRRVGVMLSDQQEKMIKEFMSVNDVMSAQKIILKELQTEFGGAAIAAGDRALGSFVKLQNAIGDLSEVMGRNLLIQGQGVITWLTALVQNTTLAIEKQYQLSEALRATSEQAREKIDFQLAIDRAKELIKFEEERIRILNEQYIRASGQYAIAIKSQLDLAKNALTDANNNLRSIENQILIYAKESEERTRKAKEAQEELKKQEEESLRLEREKALELETQQFRLQNILEDYNNILDIAQQLKNFEFGALDLSTMLQLSYNYYDIIDQLTELDKQIQAGLGTAMLTSWSTVNTSSSMAQTVPPIAPVVTPIQFYAGDMVSSFGISTESMRDTWDVMVSDMERRWTDLTKAIQTGFSVVNDLLDAFYTHQTSVVESRYDKEEDRINSLALSETDRQIELIKLERDKERELYRIQYEQAVFSKAVSIADATIKGGQAIISALTIPPPFGQIAAAVIGGITAAQIALMASTPIPAMAEGGYVNKPTIAMIGERGPEWVINEKQLKNLGTNNYYIINGSLLTENALYKKIVKNTGRINRGY